MTLGDLSNIVLVQLQQPPPSFTTGGAPPTGPMWSSVTNPQYSQGLVEFCINEGYKKLMGDLEDLELSSVVYTFSSTVNTFKYTFPPVGYAQVSHIQRIYYQPFGLPYNREFRPGTELVSWAKFTRVTGQNYLLPYSFGTQPTWATVDPTRTTIYFYPGSARSGDTITVEYAPIPTPYISGVAATGCSILVNPSDAPILPYDCHMAIAYYALSLLWIRGREEDMAKLSIQQYEEEKKQIRFRYTKIQKGDIQTIEPFFDRIAIGEGM